MWTENSLVSKRIYLWLSYAEICILHCVEEIHSVGTINNVETSYFTQLKICYLMTTFRCPSDILITSWLFTARWSTWPENHLVPCWVSRILHPDSCTSVSSWSKVPLLSIWSVAVPLCRPLLPVPVDDMVLFHSMVCDGWLVSYTALSSSCKQSRRDHDVRRTSKRCH